jgi:hypothetical protein
MRIIYNILLYDRYNVKLCVAGLLPKKFSSASKLSKRLSCLNKNVMKNIEKNNVIQKKEMRNTVKMKQDNSKTNVKTQLQPTGVALSCYDDLESNNDVTIEETVFLSSSLDESLAWCENAIIRESFPSWNSKDISSSSQFGATSKTKNIPVYLRQIQDLCPSESEKGINMLFQRFKKESVKRGTVLWRKGDQSNQAVLVCKGSLLSNFKEEVIIFQNKQSKEKPVCINMVIYTCVYLYIYLYV